MSRKDHAKRVARERRKREERKQEQQRAQKSTQRSPNKVLSDLRALFKEDAARSMFLLFGRGLSAQEIADRANVPIDRVKRLEEKVNSLPPNLRRLLQENPAVLMNSDVLRAGIEGMWRGGN